MKMTAKRVVLPGLLALVLLASFASPASAATKTFQLLVTNVSFPVGDVFPSLPTTICGVSGPFGGQLVLNVFQVTVYDNGVFVFQSTNSVQLLDSSGNRILTDRFSASEIHGIGSLPISLGLEAVSHCTPNSGTPGKLINVHFGFTVGADGTLKQTHGMTCPTSYPFC